MTVETPKKANLVVAFRALAPNLAVSEISQETYNTLETMVSLALKRNDDDSNIFLTSISAHPNERINLIPTLVEADRCLRPGDYGLTSGTNLLEMQRVIYEEALRRSLRGAFEESTYHGLSGPLKKSGFHQARVNLIRLLPYDKRLHIFANYINSPMDYLPQADSVKIFREFSDINKFKNKREGIRVIEKAKYGLVRHLAKSAHPLTLELARELDNSNVYASISETAQRNNQEVLAKTARVILLQLAFSDTSFFNRKSDLKTQAVVHCLDMRDWEILEQELAETDFHEIIDWLRKLPTELTTNLRKGSEEREVMELVYRSIFFLNRPSSHDLANKTQRATLYAAEFLRNSNLREKLFLLYPETPQAQRIIARNQFYTSLERGNLDLAESRLKDLSPNDQQAARHALAQKRIKI